MECVFVQNKDCRFTTRAEKLTLQGQSEKEQDYCDKELFQPTDRRNGKHGGNSLTHFDNTTKKKKNKIKK